MDVGNGRMVALNSLFAVDCKRTIRGNCSNNKARNSLQSWGAGVVFHKCLPALLYLLELP